MTLHQPSGRWKLGFALSLVAAANWGALPVGAKMVLRSMDGLTMTWYRMAGAFVILLPILALRGSLPRLGSLRRGGWALLLAACAGLALNYALYALGLELTSPSNAQALIQAAPILLALGGLVFFRERFSVFQWIGFSIFLLGEGLFFRDQLRAFFDRRGAYWLGAGVMLISSAGWAAYALAQKQLLRWMAASEIMLCIYAFSAVAFLPIVHPGAIMRMSGLEQFLIVLLCANTLVAYGAFSAALAHWDASRVSAAIAVAPLLTVAIMRFGGALWPGAAPTESISPLGLAGAAILVAGCMMTALGKRSVSPAEEEEMSAEERKPCAA